jgi:fermentation-respiration switch protein FrsA (DUF1100 family)
MSNNFSLRLAIMIISTVVFLLVAGYLAVNAYLYICQRNLLYHPIVEMTAPANYGIEDTKLVKLKTVDNIEIVTWYHAPHHGHPVMLYLHGNAGNLADRAEKLKVFIGKGMGMLAISWRGFGGSGGHPTEEGLYNDARAAIKYLLDNGVELNDIFLYGESLGSGVAVQMAIEFKVRALVLEAPYDSISGRAAELYPYIPVKLLLKDHFDSIDKIGKVHIPLLIFHGYLDDVMPIAHGRKLMMAANEPKQMRIFEHTKHTDFNFDTISQMTYDFVEKYM